MSKMYVSVCRRCEHDGTAGLGAGKVVAASVMCSLGWHAWVGGQQWCKAGWLHARCLVCAGPPVCLHLHCGVFITIGWMSGRVSQGISRVSGWLPACIAGNAAARLGACMVLPLWRSQR